MVPYSHFGTFILFMSMFQYASRKNDCLGARHFVLGTRVSVIEFMVYHCIYTFIWRLLVPRIVTGSTEETKERPGVTVTVTRQSYLLLPWKWKWTTSTTFAPWLTATFFFLEMIKFTRKVLNHPFWFIASTILLILLGFSMDASSKEKISNSSIKCVKGFHLFRSLPREQRGTLCHPSWAL